MGFRIAHIGAFDFENFGDLLFVDVLEKNLIERIDVEEIVYFAPKSCKMPGKNRKVYSVTELESMVEKKPFDAIIVGGGDLVHMLKIKTFMPHISSEWVVYEVLYMWIIPSIVAEKYHIPLIWNAPGVPIVFSDEEAMAVAWLCKNIDYISVRDCQAKGVLSKAVGAERINVVPDTVLSVSNIIPADELVKKFSELHLPVTRKKYIFFQGNISFTEEDIKICADTLYKLKKRTGYDVVLQSTGYALGDNQTLDMIKQIYPNEFILADHRLDQYEILALITNSVLYIGASLHGCITANSYGVKNIVYNLNHYNKTDGFVELIGREDTRVYHSSDILSAYDKLGDIPTDEIKSCIDRIDRHFDVIAEMIEQKRRKVNKPIAQDIAEYICSVNVQMSQIPQLKMELESLNKEKQELMQKCHELKKICKELRGIQKAYLEVTTSFSWKITKPVRKVLDMVKYH